MKKCIVCHKREAQLPDRSTTSMRKRVCRECHAERLRGDLVHVLTVHEKRKVESL